MRTHRVTVTVFEGDARPSRRGKFPNRFTTSFYWDTTEHGARCLFGRERNAELGQPFPVGRESIAHDPAKPDRRVEYFVSQYEGRTTTACIVSELWPRYAGMYE